MKGLTREQIELAKPDSLWVRADEAEQQIGELEYENMMLTNRLENCTDRNLEAKIKIKKLEDELNSDVGFVRVGLYREEIKELKDANDCKSGNETCTLYETKGHPCYRHLFESENNQQQKIKELKEQLEYAKNTAQMIIGVANKTLKNK